MIDGRTRPGWKDTLLRPVLPETAIFAMICAVDMVLTVVFVKLGLAKEANPLLGKVLDQSLAAFAAVKIVSFMLPLATLEIYRPLRPKFIERSLQAGLACYLLLYIFGSIGVSGGIKTLLPELSIPLVSSR